MNDPRESTPVAENAPVHMVKAAFRHWLLALNAALGAFLFGALTAPVLAELGWRAVADVLYAGYHLTCHQWAFRSFFLFAPAQPLAVYDQAQLSQLGLDPFTFTGSPSVGWKMAVCERDLAIYAGILAVGLVYARRRQLQPMGFGLYAVLILPMAIDGFTQLFGWRESTWELRVITGLLFGVASALLVLPRLESAFRLDEPSASYPPLAPGAVEHSSPRTRSAPQPETACQPLHTPETPPLTHPLPDPVPPPSPHG